MSWISINSPIETQPIFLNKDLNKKSEDLGRGLKESKGII